VPRKNNRRYEATGLDEEKALRGYGRTESSRDGDWSVRQVPAGGATKTYRCPGCDHEILSGVAHVVAWPADERGDLGDRRHWHTGCWNARDRRGPTSRR
jgi:hypothetical protein